MIDVNLTVTGGQQIANALKKFPADIEKKLLRSAMRFAMQPMKKDAKASAPKGKRNDTVLIRGGKSLRGGMTTRKYSSGNLKKSIRIGILKRKNKGLVIASIYPDMGRKARFDGFYGRFVDQGTKKMKGRFFMRSALSRNSQSAIDRTAEYLRQALDRLQDLNGMPK